MVNLIPKKRTILIAAALLVICLLVLTFVYQQLKNIDRFIDFHNITEDRVRNTFEECAKAGNAVMESYPRRCRSEGQVFVENIGNELEKTDLIRLDSPRPKQIISSPLEITGQARGQWFFEGDFPVVLTDWDGLIIAEGYATAQGEWMTEEFVPFTAKLEFEAPIYLDRGSLILHKDNPTGLPEKDDALEIPVKFEKNISCTGEDVCIKEVTCRDGTLVEDVEVCAKINVQCITTPCDPVDENFKNRCVAIESDAFDIKPGNCSQWKEKDRFAFTDGVLVFSVEYSKDWFLHDTGRGHVFTKDKALKDIGATEGFAIGPNITINEHNFTDSGVKTYDEWLDKYGMTNKSEFFIEGSDQLVNGYAMKRVVSEAAGAGGKVLRYSAFIGAQKVLEASQYPYDPESKITKELSKHLK